MTVQDNDSPRYVLFDVRQDGNTMVLLLMKFWTALPLNVIYPLKLWYVRDHSFQDVVGLHVSRHVTPRLLQNTTWHAHWHLPYLPHYKWLTRITKGSRVFVLLSTGSVVVTTTEASASYIKSLFKWSKDKVRCTAHRKLQHKTCWTDYWIFELALCLHR